MTRLIRIFKECTILCIQRHDGSKAIFIFNLQDTFDGGLLCHISQHAIIDFQIQTCAFQSSHTYSNEFQHSPVVEGYVNGKLNCSQKRPQLLALQHSPDMVGNWEGLLAKGLRLLASQHSPNCDVQEPEKENNDATPRYGEEGEKRMRKNVRRGSHSTFN